MKRFFAAALLFSCFLLLPCFATDVVIDGKKVEFNDTTGYPFVNQDGRTLVPLRAAMEAYGASVRWDSTEKCAVVTKGVTTVVCKIGDTNIYRNSVKIPNDAAACTIDGKTYLPIRAVLEALDATVSWDGRVVVTSPGAADVIYNIEHSSNHVRNMWGEWQKALAQKDAGNYQGCIDAIKKLAPDFLAANDDNSDAMLFNHLGECYSKLGMVEEAAAAYTREGEKWETAGLPQASIAAFRKASLTQSTVQLFATTSDKAYGSQKHFGVKYEPQSGVYLGVTLKNSNKNYMNEFPATVGKDMTGYLIYADVNDPIEIYKDVFVAAREKNKLLQLSLQPSSLWGLTSIVENDERYVHIAKYIQQSGAKTLVRFACEMNDTTSHWYTEDYEMYKQKFRYVSDIFRKYAPSAAVVWSPNFYPADNMEYYYPGDEYVDYVGISAYAEYAPETDPLGLGVDRSRAAALLDKIVSLYGHKKPIIVSEGGASYIYTKTGANISGYATESLSDFYTYLPLKYPCVKMAFLFETIDAGGRAFEMQWNPPYRTAYAEAIKSPAYLSSYKDNADSGIYSFEIGNNVSVPGVVTLHSYVKTLENDIARVIYGVNGQYIGESSSAPFSLEADLSRFAGQNVNIECTAYTSGGVVCASKSYKIKVD